MAVHSLRYIRTTILSAKCQLKNTVLLELSSVTAQVRMRHGDPAQLLCALLAQQACFSATRTKVLVVLATPQPGLVKSGPSCSIA